MSDLIKVAEVGDLQPGECKTVTVGERELALFNVGGKFFVTDNLEGSDGNFCRDRITAKCRPVFSRVNGKHDVIVSEYG